MFVSLVLATLYFATVRRIHLGRMLAQHVTALLMGCILAEFGWRQGLLGYYGGLLVVFLLSIGAGPFVRLVNRQGK